MAVACWKIALLLFLSAGTVQPSELLNQAIQEFQAGDYTTAHHSLERLIGLYPRIAPAHNLLGLVLMEEKKYSEAASEFDTSLRLQPESGAARVNLGNALVQLHLDERARLEYMKALKVRPEDTVALSSVGLIYARAHNDREAVRFLADAHRLEPGNVHTASALAAEYIDLKNFFQAETVIDGLLQAGVASSEERWSLALLAMENGDPNLGLRCVASDPELQNKYYDVSYRKASELVAASQDQEALRILLKLKEMPQRSASYYDLLGTIYYKLDEPKKAVEELQKAIRLEPSNPDHYFTLGMMFLKHRTGDGAVVVFGAALKAAPNVPKLWMGLGLSYYIEGDIKTAKEKLQRAIALDPNYGPAYVVLCDLLSQTGGDQELLGIIGKALKAEPNNYLLPYYYGQALSRHDDHEAVSQFRRSISLNPGFAAAYFELGKILASGGDTTGAIDALTKCLKVDPNMAEAHYSLFHIYHSLGKQELAKSHIALFQQIRKEKGDDERVERLLFTVDK